MEPTRHQEWTHEERRTDPKTGAQRPSFVLVALATALAVAASLGADIGLVHLGTSVFPSTIGFTRFRFSDYAKLTVIGVIPACASWPAVARVASAPRWLFFRMAVAVTVVLFLPDVWLLGEGEPAKAVVVLMSMHLAIAVLTYNLLVHLAPARAARPGRDDWAIDELTTGHPARSSTGIAWTSWRAAWIIMAALVAVELLLGIAALVAVPAGRPTEWLPTDGRIVYYAHAGMGMILGIGAGTLLLTSSRQDRLSFYPALVGFIAVGAAAGGGILTAYHPERILGMILMCLGAVVGGFAYLTPATELDSTSAARTTTPLSDSTPSP